MGRKFSKSFVKRQIYYQKKDMNNIDNKVVKILSDELFSSHWLYNINRIFIKHFV